MGLSAGYTAIPVGWCKNGWGQWPLHEFLDFFKLEKIHLKMKEMDLFCSDVQWGHNSMELRSETAVHVAHSQGEPQFCFICREQGLPGCLTIFYYKFSWSDRALQV